MTAIFWIFERTAPSRVDRWFRRLQLVSAAFFSLNHGANDAQKTMGIVAGVLFAAGYIQTFYIPFWVVLAAYSAISLGTLAGGWRIIHTMGSKITKLQPVSGFAAETGAAIAIFTATYFGIPVSTTHAITGAIVGVGSTRRLSAVRWGVAGRIVWAWVLTIPASATVGATRDLLDAGIREASPDGLTPPEQMRAIRERVRALIADLYACLDGQLFPALAARGITVESFRDVGADEQRLLRDRFRRDVAP